MMDTEALWQAIAAYGNARWRGVKFEQDAADHLAEIKAILNRAEAETRELMATNERLVDEVAELKAAYESQFKELHELKSKLTEKASLLRGCYAADHKQKQRIEELIAELERLRKDVDVYREAAAIMLSAAPAAPQPAQQLLTEKDALLRQALEALENGARVRNAEGGTKYQPPIEEAAIDAIRTHLGVKND